METELSTLIAIGGSLLGSTLLGFTKKYTSMMDGKVGSFVKPVQPLLVMAAGIGLPMLTDRLGLGPIDPRAFIAAPTTTLALISVREANERLQGRK